MKILYFFMQYPTPMYLWQNEHIVDELAHHGIEMEIFNPLNFGSVDEANEKVVKRLSENKYDLFMTCHGKNICYVETIKQIKHIGIPTLLICFDNLVAPYMHLNVCRYYDVVWLTSNENKGMFKSRSANLMVAPYAANPYSFNYKQCDEVEEIVFIGSPYGSRANLLNSITDNQMPVSLYGNISVQERTTDIANKSEKLFTAMKYLTYPAGRTLLWAYIHQKKNKSATLNVDTPYLNVNAPVPVKDLSMLYSSYALCLSSTTARNSGVLKKPLYIVNLRSFEIPMCGGIQFCRRSAEIEEYFEDEKEIVLFDSDNDMIEKAKFYLRPENESIRMAIRQNARKRAESEHTWFCRFKMAFDCLGLSLR